MHSRVLIVLACIAGLGFGLLGFRWVETAAPPAALQLDEVTFTDLGGTRQNLSRWSGKVLVVNFWASWCPPCREEMPVFTRLQRELGDSDVQFLGIAIDDPNQVRAYLSGNPVNYPILIGEAGGAEWAAELGNALQVLPFSAVIDRSGHVVRVKSGPFSYRELRDLLTGLVQRMAPV